MKRKLFCELSPLTYRLSMEKEILRRHLKDFLGKTRFARERTADSLPVLVYQHKDLTVDESRITRTKAIIQSMTEEERTHPEIIKASRKKRIAAGSGTELQDVNALLKQFEASREMMKRMKNGRRGGFPF